MPCAVEEQVVTDRLLRSWLRCRRRAWLDRHGDPSQRLWSAHRTLQLDDQQRCFVGLLGKIPGQGEAACAAGDAAVVGLRLVEQVPGGLRLEGHPPLLVRTAGSSRWGSHAYQPALARQGRRLTREHRLMLTLWGRLLAGFQGAPVSHGLVVAGHGRHQEREQLPLTAALNRQLDDALPRLAAELASAQPPPLVNDRRKCVLCSWRGACDREAAAEGHLSEVSGIGGKRRELLIELGLQRLSDLAGAEPEQLADALEVHGEQHREIAAQLVAQARVQQQGTPVRLEASPALADLERAPGLLLYDIESDPDARDDFLHGFLRIKRQADGSWPTTTEGSQYLPVLGLHEHGEARLWQRLRLLLDRHPGWPLLHYGETESVSLCRLAQRQGEAEREVQALRGRMIDLHKRVRRHWLMPVSSYGLKAVASWLGFRWGQKGVDGARCLLWWRQWRGDGSDAGRGSRHNLLRILRYNRDDCRATWAVATWLLTQDPAVAALPAPTGGALNPAGSEISSDFSGDGSPDGSPTSSRSAPSA
ncbi:TM0106 family RecB-like putative nuclease [Synechococcus sp. CS-602]|uniref:TM0106 family RecB-like putative nuclease n=1 Tax=Synechococcaceae TaxID=1890426 RepID=UPI0009F8CF58|nr:MULTISPECIES: TM0106 family RecB-like putative nuclease [Synechococcaceae]MCT4364982.1 TM0106 family RecB-like putative nuclease [Candidatus Regnicoccus frigidus MAG-AL1]MCT0202951.1 TM0106 family RecB-like putative nuclease [Synechococcus sp. CS-603]MCT0205804.1 TM0106 family RecB-like putative nuclease [Synechococcus sp. CS-602]MCT0245210.1 TM0106 family RecB-like putative nuclease [Synechococcus sp. CS-601]MCT4367209.1 TM0106 family RecB-like putative nuclease [Candidatus Regnicoccus fri